MFKTGPNGIFINLDTHIVRCGDFTRTLDVALLGGRLLNRHGEVLNLTESQYAWIKRFQEVSA